MKMTVRVVDVIDGGSLRVSSGGIVRLRDVAAPSLMTLAGMQAKSRLEELVLHKHVQCEELDSDPDGNIIARVWADGIDINETLCPAQSGVRAAKAPPSPAGPARKVEVQLDESAFRAPGDKEGR
jgi:endonuclease YncB( thermonuclease family)